MPLQVCLKGPHPALSQREREQESILLPLPLGEGGVRASFLPTVTYPQ